MISLLNYFELFASTFVETITDLFVSTFIKPLKVMYMLCCEYFVRTDLDPAAFLGFFIYSALVIWTVKEFLLFMHNCRVALNSIWKKRRKKQREAKQRLLKEERQREAENLRAEQELDELYQFCCSLENSK